MTKKQKELISRIEAMEALYNLLAEADEILA